jgi:hypothetical protein
MAQEMVLFCPFCRESFEGEQVCPEHEIQLVPFDRLPQSDLDAHDDESEPDRLSDDAVLSTFDPRVGRAWVGAGALFNALSLLLVFAYRSDDGKGVHTYELATRSPSLWTLALVSFTLLFVLKRRRTPRALRGLRVLVPALACVSPITVAWVMYRLREGLVARTPPIHEPGVAVALVLIAAALVFFGGLRLGILPRSRTS